MKTNINEKLEKLIEFNVKSNNVLLATLSKFDTKPHAVNSIIFISYNLVKRFSSIIKSTNFFLNDLKNDNSNEMQIGLLLRPILLDILSFEYIINEFANNLLENYKLDFSLSQSKVEKYLADNLIHYRKEAEKLHNDSFISKDEIKNINKLLKRISIDNFGKDIFQDSKKYSFPSASNLYNAIKDSPATKKYVPVISLYWHYSKYEHFGLLTAIMPNENVNGIIDITNRLTHSFSIINRFMIDLLVILQLDFKEMKVMGKEYDKMLADFD